MTFEIVDRESIATGAHLSFDRLTVEGPNGERADRYMLAHPGAVAFLPVDGADVLMIRQYRAPIDQTLLEIPAGKLDPGDNDRLSAVRRECMEEVGMRPGSIHPLGFIYTSGGITDERIDLYWVSDLTPVPTEPDGMEEEHAQIVRLPVDELVELLATGELTDAKSVAAVARFMQRDRA